MPTGIYGPPPPSAEAIGKAVAAALVHVFSWKNAVSAACLAASEYAMLSLIEDAPRAIKLATFIAPLAAFLTIQFEKRLRAVHVDLYPTTLVLICVGYLAFGGYVYYLSPYQEAGHPVAQPTTVAEGGNLPPDISVIGLRQRFQDAQTNLSNANGKIAELQTRLDAETQRGNTLLAERDGLRARQDAAARQLNESRDQLAAAQLAAKRLGPVNTSNLINALTQPGALKEMPGWLVVVTSGAENERVKSDVVGLITVSSSTSKTLIPITPPDYSRDLDAPRLQGAADPGITIHGRNAAGDFLAAALRNCFVIHQTAGMPDGLLPYYYRIWPHLSKEGFDKIVWLEIGNGSPWSQRGCLD
jgi:hypothetical protein